jgi:hypothetical protein
VKNGKALLKFTGISGGLNTRRVALNIDRGYVPGKDPKAVVAEAAELKGFTICGEDQKFVAAEAKIVSKDAVLVYAPEVKDPVAVRYGWSNFPLCNLYGGNGMPASPFRTDDFPKPNLTGEKLSKPFSGIQSEWGSIMELLNAGDGTFRTVEVDGQPASQADGAFLYAAAPHMNEPMNVLVKVVYFDKGFGTIQLRYDSTAETIYDGKKAGVWKPAGEVNCVNSSRWKVAEFELPDAKFSKRCNGGDLRLQSTGGLVVGGLFVQER